MGLELVSHAERPEAIERVVDLEQGSFPEFLLHDGFDEVRPHLFEEFADFQLYVFDDSTGALLGAGNALPFHRGTRAQLPAFQELIAEAPRQHAKGLTADLLCPIQAMLVEDARGVGISRQISEAYQEKAARHGIDLIGTPVRPTMKPLYPITPIDAYVRWRRSDGLPFDPWLRAQERLGGRFVEICHESTVIEASVAEWESWTGMEFPESGDFVIPDGHVPLVVDRERDCARYAEPHVWYIRDAR